METFGQHIKNLRKSRANKMSIYELAAKIGVTAATISKYERDRHLPPMDVIHRMAQVLGTNVDDLMAIAYPERYAGRQLPDGESNTATITAHRIPLFRAGENHKSILLTDELCPYPSCIAVRVTDNMHQAKGILDGDIVVFSPEVTTSSSDTVVVYVRKDGDYRLGYTLLDDSEGGPGEEDHIPQLMLIYSDNDTQRYLIVGADDGQRIHPILSVIRLIKPLPRHNFQIAVKP